LKFSCPHFVVVFAFGIIWLAKVSFFCCWLSWLHRSVVRSGVILRRGQFVFPRLQVRRRWWRCWCLRLVLLVVPLPRLSRLVGRHPLLSSLWGSGTRLSFGLPWPSSSRASNRRRRGEVLFHLRSPSCAGRPFLLREGAVIRVFLRWPQPQVQPQTWGRRNRGVELRG
jgi:hypothetical protein